MQLTQDSNTNDYAVRKATQGDVFNIVFSVKQFCKSVPHRAWGRFNAEKVSTLVHSLINDREGFVYVVDYKGDIVGALIGVIADLAISDDTVAQELMLWIDPEHRNNRAALELLDTYVKWSEAMGCTFARLSSVDELMGSKVGILFRRKGFKAVETAYLKEI
jgi:GNAT superfamily N-acetyltransferase